MSLSAVLATTLGFTLTHRVESLQNVTVKRDCNKPSDDFMRISANIHRLNLSDTLQSDEEPKAHSKTKHKLEPRAEKSSSKLIELFTIKTYVHVVHIIHQASVNYLTIAR